MPSQTFGSPSIFPPANVNPHTTPTTVSNVPPAILNMAIACSDASTGLLPGITAGMDPRELSQLLQSIQQPASSLVTSAAATYRISSELQSLESI
ncbi:hypothetical protein Moror_8428 [Moniliophthora roreri MCA 2997]|uniref:Uncharacterized protein n=3 Tax=Moniliophthora roreri TaxID=221103 RepID=V2W5A0_MONRO|nr:hypothetical protein Moror_8428 [Moniliophthora roreri MCA 2997]